MSNVMKKFCSIYLATLLLFTVSCSINLDEDEFIPDSDIETLKGGSVDIFEQYSDLHPLSYTIKDLSRSNDTLNIDVQYGGGEGGCPAHLFVLRWDENIYQTRDNISFAKFELAHFIPTVVNCEALVNERLKIDLAELMGDQLSDTLGFKVFNVVDSTEVNLKLQ